MINGSPDCVSVYKVAFAVSLTKSFFSLKISYAQHTGKTMIANMLMIKIAYLT